MRIDDIKPSGKAQNIKPNASINVILPGGQAERTSALVYDQGITYNEAGLTYNEIGYAYGGVYGQQDTRPIASMAQVIKPTMRIERLPGGEIDDSGRSGSPIGLLLSLTYP